MSDSIPEAFVELVPEETLRQVRPQKSPYDFGTVPPMGRLLMSHPEIGPVFGQLFAQIMFAPGVLSRAEKEMVAGVAAAAQDCHY